MKKLVFSASLAAVAAICIADIFRTGEYEPRVCDDLKLRIEKIGSEYLISEDAELFRAKFATVHYPEYHLSYAQHKELTRRIAKTIAEFHSATNGQIRFGHYEYPESKGTNIIDKLIQPCDTRKYLIGSLQMLMDKAEF